MGQSVFEDKQKQQSRQEIKTTSLEKNLEGQRRSLRQPGEGQGVKTSGRATMSNLHIDTEKKLNRQFGEIDKKQVKTVKKQDNDAQQTRRKTADKKLTGGKAAQKSAGPKYIGMSWDFVEHQQDDSKRMIKVRNALQTYLAARDSKAGRRKYTTQYLRELIDACNDYTFLRCRWSRWDQRGKDRIDEVRALRAQAEEKLAYETRKGNLGPELEHNDTVDERFVQLGGEVSTGGKIFGGIAAGLRTVIENPIRLGLGAVTLPFWAINEGIRGIQKLRGKVPNRHIKLPGLYSPKTFYKMTIRRCRGLKNRGGADAGAGSRFWDNFLTDYKKDKDILARAEAERKEMYEDEFRYRNIEALISKGEAGESDLYYPMDDSFYSEYGSLIEGNAALTDEEDEDEQSSESETSKEEKTVEKSEEEKKEENTSEIRGDEHKEEQTGDNGDGKPVEEKKEENKEEKKEDEKEENRIESNIEEQESFDMDAEEEERRLAEERKKQEELEKRRKAAAKIPDAVEKRNFLIRALESKLTDPTEGLLDLLTNDKNTKFKQYFLFAYKAELNKQLRSITRSKIIADMKAEGIEEYDPEEREISARMPDMLDAVPKEFDGFLYEYQKRLVNGADSRELDRFRNDEKDRLEKAGQTFPVQLNARLYALTEAIRQAETATLFRDRLVAEGRQAREELKPGEYTGELKDERQNLPVSCWACSGTMNANNYIAKHPETVDPNFVMTQGHFLNPANIVLNQEAKDQAMADPDMMAQIKEEIDIAKKMVTGRREMGNPYAFGDVFLKNLSDTAIRRTTFTIDRNNPLLEDTETRNAIKAEMFRKIQQALDEAKGPVTLLIPGHYITVTGVTGSHILYHDSKSEEYADPKAKKENPGVSTTLLKRAELDQRWTMNAEQLLKYATMRSVEIVSLVHLDEETTGKVKDEFGIHAQDGQLYDKDGKLQAAPPEEAIKQGGNLERIYQNLGVEFTKPDEKSGVLRSLEFMQESVYLPKNRDHKANVKDNLPEQDLLDKAKKKENVSEQEKKQEEKEENKEIVFDEKLFEEELNEDEIFADEKKEELKEEEKKEEEKKEEEKKEEEKKEEEKKEEEKTEEEKKEQEEQEKEGNKNEILIGRFAVKVLSGQQFLSSYGKVLADKKMGVHEREKLLTDPKTVQAVKKQLSDRVLSGREKTANRMIRSRRAVTIGSRVKLTAVAAESGIFRDADQIVEALSAFMEDNVKSDNAMVDAYADRKTRTRVLDQITGEIDNLDVNIKLTTDEEFAANAARLEEISAKARACEKLLLANPDYVENLKKRDKTGQEFADLQTKLSKLLALSDYYRARKLLMTSDYAILRDNSELGPETKENATRVEKNAALLVKLTAQCADRLQNPDSLARLESDMEEILAKQEEESRRNAYLTGKPDLTKADVGDVVRFQAKLHKYYNVINPKDNPGWEDKGSEIEIKIAKDQISDPKALALEDEEIKNWKGLVKDYTLLSPKTPNRRGTLYDELQTRKFDKLLEFLYPDGKQGGVITEFELKNPKTGEVLNSKISPARVVNDIVFMYDYQLPEEELYEMMEGLLIGSSKELDFSKEEDYAYAKQRWLASEQKLFRLMTAAMKRSENTYGTLINKLPASCFFHSLGEGQGKISERMFYTQDVTQMVDDKEIKLGKESFSPAEYMLREGYITQEEIDNARTVCASYYQNVFYAATSYITGGPELFQVEPDEQELSALPNALLKPINEIEKTHKFEGPDISRAEQKKIWEKAIETDDQAIMGSKDGEVQVMQQELGILSDSEKAVITDQRKTQLEELTIAEKAYVDKENQVFAAVRKEKRLKNVPDETLKKLIAFHPDLRGEKKATKKERQEFFSLVENYCGINVPETKQKECRMAVAERMIRMIAGVSGPGTGVTDDPSELVRKGKNEKFSGNLIRRECRQRMIHVTDAFLFDGDNQDIVEALDKIMEAKVTTYTLLSRFRKEHMQNVCYEALKKMMKSREYLKLKDIGNTLSTEGEKELAFLNNIVPRFKDISGIQDFEREITPEISEKLAKSGIMLRSRQQAKTVAEEKKEETGKTQATKNLQAEEFAEMKKRSKNFWGGAKKEDKQEVPGLDDLNIEADLKKLAIEGGVTGGDGGADDLDLAIDLEKELAEIHGSDGDDFAEESEIDAIQDKVRLFEDDPNMTEEASEEESKEKILEDSQNEEKKEENKEENKEKKPVRHGISKDETALKGKKKRPDAAAPDRRNKSVIHSGQRELDKVYESFSEYEEESKGTNEAGSTGEERISTATKRRSKTAEKEIDLENRKSILSEEELEENIRTEQGGTKPIGVLMGDDGLQVFSKKTVKKGAFTEEQISGAEEFMDKMDAWAGVANEDEQKLFASMKIKDTVDMLYVDGMPLRQFAEKQYGYKKTKSISSGMDTQILRTYAAMIATRHNHPITLIRPVMRDGKVSVEFRNLKSIMTFEDTQSQKEARRSVQKTQEFWQKGEAVAASLKDVNEKKMAQDAAKAYRKANGQQFAALENLDRIKEWLDTNKGGTHDDYRQFRQAFENYRDAVNMVAAYPETMPVSSEIAHTLLGHLRGVIQTGSAYLKGKSMKLARHLAVQNTLEEMARHFTNMHVVIESDALKAKDSTVSLKKFLSGKD